MIDSPVSGTNGQAAGDPPEQRQPEVDAEQGARRDVVETPEFAAMMTRMIRAWGRRVAVADTYDLAELVAFRGEVDDAIDHAITEARKRSVPWSWSEIGDALGMSKQAAHKRWGTP